MTKSLSLAMAVLTGLLAGGQPKAPAGAFTVQFLCASPEVYRIDYVAALEGEYLCTGGTANFEKVPLHLDPTVFVYFSQGDLEGREEGRLSLELHLYDEEEGAELAVLGPVEMQARLGEKRIIKISGDKGGGFAARLA